MIKGKLDKSSLSTKKNSIIHYVWDKYGPDKTQKFIDDSQRLILNYLMLRGYSIGFQDAVLPLTDRNKIENLINSKILEYKFKITEMENESIKFDPSLFESTLTGDLSTITSNVEKIMKNSLDLNNNLFVAIDSGAKGSFFNLQQIMGCLGQQLLEGTRIKKKISGRTLPHYHYQDDTPEARGFIKNSYLSGLTGCDYFWQAAAGREGLIDTAIKSVSWDTPVVIQSKGKTQYKQIGEWIDDTIKLSENNNSYKYSYEKINNLEIVELPDGVYIPTTDYHGNVSWGKVSAVTRHDPGEKLYQIKTDGGRSVVVTAAKSLLIWNKETRQFKEKLTPEVVVGDLVPVTQELAEPPLLTKTINVSDYLPKSEYIYGTDYNKAVKLMNLEMTGKDRCSKNWWNEVNKKEFELPYKSKSSLLRHTQKIYLLKIIEYIHMVLIRQKLL